MKRIKLTVAYDGTNYYGWQKQPDAVTVEEVVNRELTRLLQEPIEVIGASRTDSGVHALGNVAVFDTDTRIPPEKISYALNARLPKDIVIQDSKEVPPDFHPRRTDCVKTYEYRILNTRFPVPTMRLYAHYVYKPLDVEKMQAAAAFLVGEHDFASFCSAGSQVKETVRTIYRLDLKREGNMVSFQVEGNGFLYNMVRIIAGTLIEVGIGSYPPERVREMLEARDRIRCGPKAPACGLTLVGIRYPVLEEQKS
ncbi:MAG TPA: tRNA pseudouridine(38-40) synthase TruA [Candidatus Caccomorpha excrementavium]|nr:tRNA pseudouridine(38-40) synthase TruA [Candidatus Caccomorpha excrementavium]